jgi:tight adherence protein B
MLTIGLSILGVAIFAASYQYSKKFLDWLRFQSIGTRDYVIERLQLMFIDYPPHQIMIAMFAVSFGLGTITFLAFLPKLFPAIFFGVIVAVIGWKAPRPVVDYLYRKRTETFVLQLVDALNLMSNGMKSGLSVIQSIGLVVQEMPKPAQQEFNLVLSENKLGVPLEEALNNLAKRVVSDDVEMLVTSINILKETGGNLAETFDTISGTIRERIKVEKKIQVLTASGLYQGMFVMAMPPLLGLVFYQSDPEFMSPLFSTTIGWIVISLILALEVIAFFVIMKIVKIQV